MELVFAIGLPLLVLVLLANLDMMDEGIRGLWATWRSLLRWRVRG